MQAEAETAVKGSAVKDDAEEDRLRSTLEEYRDFQNVICIHQKEHAGCPCLQDILKLWNLRKKNNNEAGY